jgi:hypothetical protein
MNINIIGNLTQHPVSPAQKKDGVVDPHDKEAVKELLTFDTLPTQRRVFFNPFFKMLVFFA